MASHISNSNRVVVGLINIEIDSSYFHSSETTSNEIPLVYLGKYPLPIFKVKSANILQHEPLENFFIINCFVETREFSKKAVTLHHYNFKIHTKIEDNVLSIDNIFFEIENRAHIPKGPGVNFKYDN